MKVIIEPVMQYPRQGNRYTKRLFMIKARISILDGFRSLAILSVLLYHFFSRWVPPENDISLYPYKNAYDYFGIGQLGVQFFFIISGFVIFFTLDTTANFSSFLEKKTYKIASFHNICFFNYFCHLQTL